MKIFSRHKKFFAGMTAASIIFASSSVFAAYEDDGEIISEPPPDTYMWVQSTPRGNYWFNYKHCGYRLRSDGTLDLNTLIVPTVCLYDSVQIQDVIQKRKWKKLSTRGYERLAGRADVLKFDLSKGTVQVEERIDIDDTWAHLDRDTTDQPVELNQIPVKDIRYKFYRTILEWVKKNNELIIGRSRGKLSEADGDLTLDQVPINKIFIPPAVEE